MVTFGWRRAFCTSIPDNEDHGHTHIFSEKQLQVQPTQSRPRITSGSPRISSKLGFFSAPSTSRLQSLLQQVSSSEAPVPAASLQCQKVASIQKLQCKTSAAPTPEKTIHLSSSNPSSPKSPSSFSFLRASLRFPRATRCRICLHSVKTGQGTAIFTAECSHTFHFPCVAARLKNHRDLFCPVCSAAWKEVPWFENSFRNMQCSPRPPELKAAIVVNNNTKPLKVYDDDESLLSPSSVSRFNPIPESDESSEDPQHEVPVESQGFFAASDESSVPSMSKPSRYVHKSNAEISMLEEAALVSSNKNSSTCAVVLKVKAPAAAHPNGRLPVDLVAVLDVSSSMNATKIQAMKRAMRQLISSFSDADRLSIVAFSATSKRLLPLRRMTVLGRRSARRIVDTIGCTRQPASVNDALKKAAKVLEDRREKNSFATVVLLSDGHDHHLHGNATDRSRSYPVVTSSRLGGIPVHAVGFGDDGDQAVAQVETFGKRLAGLLRVTVQDMRLQLGFALGSDPAQITAVYSLIGRPSGIGSGLVRLGDLYAEEERELLVELKLKASDFSSRSHYVISVGSAYREPLSQELVYSSEQPIPVPQPQPVRTPSIQRLKNFHVTARAVTETQRLVDRSDLSGACRMLSSAMALLAQSGLGPADPLRCRLHAELAEVQRLRQAAEGGRLGRPGVFQAEEKPEQLTPTSGWRAAERLAKMANTRKSMNRVSDLHGLEDARF
ncbi:hypothetical protein SAY86_028238 [Trapa natans]|uniref:Uncharacterized protein n=1 Tax=Trapa natans TaxID=22666 RepID=A0AAN7M0Q5_TRANT|nr:hypothetical protein SAY86_028238 [Trapa natans]